MKTAINKLLLLTAGVLVLFTLQSWTLSRPADSDVFSRFLETHEMPVSIVSAADQKRIDAFLVNPKNMKKPLSQGQFAPFFEVYYEMYEADGLDANLDVSFTNGAGTTTDHLTTDGANGYWISGGYSLDLDVQCPVTSQWATTGAYRLRIQVYDKFNNTWVSNLAFIIQSRGPYDTPDASVPTLTYSTTLNWVSNDYAYYIMLYSR